MDCASVDTTQIGFIGQKRRKDKYGCEKRPDGFECGVERVVSAYALKERAMFEPEEALSILPTICAQSM